MKTYKSFAEWWKEQDTATLELLRLRTVASCAWAVSRRQATEQERERCTKIVEGHCTCNRAVSFHEPECGLRFNIAAAIREEASDE